MSCVLCVVRRDTGAGRAWAAAAGNGGAHTLLLRQGPTAQVHHEYHIHMSFIACNRCFKTALSAAGLVAGQRLVAHSRAVVWAARCSVEVLVCWGVGAYHEFMMQR